MLNQKQSYTGELSENRSFNAAGTLGVITAPSTGHGQATTNGDPAAPHGDPVFQAGPDPRKEASQSRQQAVLRRLQSAYLMAIQMKRDPWDFAIEISDVGSADTSDLRSLIYKGLMEHRAETTSQGSPRRTFQNETDVMLSSRSCFIITPQGIRTLVAWMSSRPESDGTQASVGTGDHQQTPVWDSNRRELRLGDRVVKLFRWPAQNQETILNAFQAQGWPAMIADPLPQDPNICAKRRLHDTIKCLNRRRIQKLIKFRGDGTGRGVKLELMPLET